MAIHCRAAKKKPPWHTTIFFMLILPKSSCHLFVIGREIGTVHLVTQLRHTFEINNLCNGWEHYVPYRCLQISNKLCDSTLCTCGGVGGWRNRCIMLIMPLDPSWRQTLRLPPPGIEPGSPASQAGTPPKELSRQLIPGLRIRDLYPRSRILIFFFFFF